MMNEGMLHTRVAAESKLQTSSWIFQETGLAWMSETASQPLELGWGQNGLPHGMENSRRRCRQELQGHLSGGLVMGSPHMRWGERPLGLFVLQEPVGL